MADIGDFLKSNGWSQDIDKIRRFSESWSKPVHKKNEEDRPIFYFYFSIVKEHAGFDYNFNLSFNLRNHLSLRIAGERQMDISWSSFPKCLEMTKDLLDRSSMGEELKNFVKKEVDDVIDSYTMWSTHEK